VKQLLIATLIVVSLAAVAMADGSAWICDDDRCILIDLSTGTPIPQ
jgi:hypothetical protein